jgi:spectinomycin phosphotransferase
MVERAEILAHSLDDARTDRVLCHSDAHLGNFLVSDTETVYLVDWDNPIFAPRERDLMFFGTGMFAKDQVEPEKTWFYNGYGPVEINPIALAYFLYERVIDDIAEFCNQLLLSDLGGEDREQAYTFLTSTFNPGGWADVALRHDAGNLRAMDAPE